MPACRPPAPAAAAAAAGVPPGPLRPPAAPGRASLEGEPLNSAAAAFPTTCAAATRLPLVGLQRASTAPSCWRGDSRPVPPGAAAAAAAGSAGGGVLRAAAPPRASCLALPRAAPAAAAATPLPWALPPAAAPLTPGILPWTPRPCCSDCCGSFLLPAWSLAARVSVAAADPGRCLPFSCCCCRPACCSVASLVSCLPLPAAAGGGIGTGGTIRVIGILPTGLGADAGPADGAAASRMIAILPPGLGAQAARSATSGSCCSAWRPRCCLLLPAPAACCRRECITEGVGGCMSAWGVCCLLPASAARAPAPAGGNRRRVRPLGPAAAAAACAGRRPAPDCTPTAAGGLTDLLRLEDRSSSTAPPPAAHPAAVDGRRGFLLGVSGPATPRRVAAAARPLPPRAPAAAAARSAAAAALAAARAAVALPPGATAGVDLLRLEAVAGASGGSSASCKRRPLLGVMGPAGDAGTAAARGLLPAAAAWARIRRPPPPAAATDTSLWLPMPAPAALLLLQLLLLPARLPQLGLLPSGSGVEGVWDLLRRATAAARS